MHTPFLIVGAGLAYLTLNLIGAGLACYSSYLIRFMPFVVLEGTWAVAAVVAIARRPRSRSTAA